MLLKQLNRDEEERLYVSAQNVAGETMSNGVFVCWDWQNSASHGNAIVKPTTSTLGLFAGVLAHKAPSYADLPANSYGLVQIYGVHGSCTYNVAGTSVSAAGQYLIPVNAQYSGQGDTEISGGGLDFTSQVLIVSRGAMLLDNDLSGSGRTTAFVRAL